MRIIALVFMVIFMTATSAFAQAPKRYASIVVDADTLEIIHARQIDGQRFPASLTKVMTLYLTFDAINNGSLRIDEKLKVSRAAANAEPVDIGLRAGQTITVEQAIQALTVRSANDAAIVLAERLAGSERAFAAKMTLKARELKMQRTVFMTANGLPHPDQTTTARDMAKLASAVLNHHRRYYHYFGQSQFTWKGRTYQNTNKLLGKVSGVDGFKTGFTNASGYNLVISAERNGRRIIAVVLGGASGNSRNQHMTDLIKRSFGVIEKGPAPARQRVVVNHAPTPKITPQNASLTQAVRLRGRGHGQEFVSVTQGKGNIKIANKDYDRSWSIQVGAFTAENTARQHLSAVATHPSLDTRLANISPIMRAGHTLYRARFAPFSAPQAQEICRSMPRRFGACHVVAPGT